MIAQQILDECDTQKFNPRQFRDEINISWFLQDVVKQFKEVENGKNTR